MIDTGKKLTTEQITKVKEAMSAPLMYLSGGQRMYASAQETVHRFALENGLPEIPGYYGADLRTGTIYKV